MGMKSRPGRKRDPHSLSGYARRRKAAGLPGGTLRAVQQSIEDGRLAASVRRRGSRWCVDYGLADQEWAAFTEDDRVPHSGPTSSPGNGHAASAAAIQRARARRVSADAELAELKLAERRGELVMARDVEARLVSVFQHCKTKLLGIPSRARQRDPALGRAQISMLEELIREALEELGS